MPEHDLLTPTARRVGAELYAELLALNDKIAQADRVLVEALSSHPAYPRLKAVPGIGPVVAASLLAAVGNAQQFRNGRQLAAWAGLVPRHTGSGGKTTLLGITKNGESFSQLHPADLSSPNRCCHRSNRRRRACSGPGS